MGRGPKPHRWPSWAAKWSASTYSGKLLDEERARAPRPLELVSGDLLAVGDEHTGSYDVVCCHDVAMYPPSLDETTAAMCEACRPGGLPSEATRVP